MKINVVDVRQNQGKWCCANVIEVDIRGFNLSRLCYAFAITNQLLILRGSFTIKGLSNMCWAHNKLIFFWKSPVFNCSIIEKVVRKIVGQLHYMMCINM